MTRKGIESNFHWRSEMSKNTGVALVFSGFVLLSIWRVLLITHLGLGLKVFSFATGIALCILGLAIAKGARRS